MERQDAYRAAIAASRKYHDRVTYVLYFSETRDWDIATSTHELDIFVDAWQGTVTQAYSCGQALH